MKTIFAITGLALLSFTAQAQESNGPQFRLKPGNNTLKLDYQGKESSAGKRHSLDKPGNRYSVFPKPSVKYTSPKIATRPTTPMPVLMPDATIRFSILALKPDSTVSFPMPILKY